MDFVSILGGIIMLAFVLHEVQCVVQACIYALDWPSEVSVKLTPTGLVAAKGKPLTLRARLNMAGYRAAEASLFCHEVHSYRMRQPVVFRAIPSMAFGAFVFLVGYFVGQSVDLAAPLSVCAAAMAFASSQTRSLVRFHANRVDTDAKLHALFKSLASTQVNS